MKNLINLALMTLVFIILFVNASFAQSPFADQEVNVTRQIQQGNDNVEFFSQQIWQGIKNGIWQSAQKIWREGKKLVNVHKTPEFVTGSFKIPGHETRHFVCQGICYLPEKVISPASQQPQANNSKVALLSYYPVEKHTDLPAQIVAIDLNTGKPLRRFSLYLSAEKPYTGHAGGITAAGRYLWVASGYNLRGFSLQSILDFINDETALASTKEQKIPPSFRIPEQKLIASLIFPVDSTASFVSFSGQHLWVGDFVKSSNKSYGPVDHHTQNPWQLKTWISGYLVDANGKPTAKTTYSFTADGKTHKAHKPDKIILCRESVQGMAVCDQHIALSISYGAQNSKLALYRNHLAKEGKTISYKPAGQKKSFSVQAFVLAERDNWVKTFELPAGAEDLEFNSNHIFVTFEGGSENYRHRWSLNPLVKIEEKFFVISLKKLLAI